MINKDFYKILMILTRSGVEEVEAVDYAEEIYNILKSEKEDITAFIESHLGRVTIINHVQAINKDRFVKKNGYRVITIATKDFNSEIKDVIKNLSVAMESEVYSESTMDKSDIEYLKSLSGKEPSVEAIKNLDDFSKKGKKFGISERTIIKTNNR